MTSTSVEVPSPVAAPQRTAAAALPLAVLGTALVVAGTLSILALHVIPPTSSVDPLRRTISEYAYSDLGGVFNGGVIAVALGSALIGLSLLLSKTVRGNTWGVVSLLAWSVALVVLVIFPKHDWSVGPSSHGSIHRVASLVAFFTVPIAAIAIGRRRSGRLRTPARLAIGSGIVAALWLATLLGGFVAGPITNLPWYRVFPLGLMERGMAFFAVGGVVGLGWLAIRAARSVAGPQSGAAGYRGPGEQPAEDHRDARRDELGIERPVLPVAERADGAAAGRPALGSVHSQLG